MLKLTKISTVGVKSAFIFADVQFFLSALDTINLLSVIFSKTKSKHFHYNRLFSVCHFFCEHSIIYVKIVLTFYLVIFL
jgi:hypothetical protein